MSLFSYFSRKRENNKKLALSVEDKRELLLLAEKPFDRLTDEERKKLLELGAKDFSKKFISVIKTLASE